MPTRYHDRPSRRQRAISNDELVVIDQIALHTGDLDGTYHAPDSPRHPDPVSEANAQENEFGLVEASMDRQA